MNDAMGGQVLKLQSEIIEERVYFELVQKGGLSIPFAAEQLKMSEEEFEKQMKSAGYKIPELI